MHTLNVRGVPITAVSRSSALDLIESWIEAGRREYVCFVNVHLVETARRDLAVARALSEASLALPDGAPVAWVASAIGLRRVERVTGSDVFAGLCSRAAAKGYRLFLVGGTSENSGRLVRDIQVKYPGAVVAGAAAPPFRALTETEKTQLSRELEAARPDIVWVGLGAPKQELWMADFRERISAPVILGVGAVFEFATGSRPRAPRWIQRAGLEWLHRLVHEPRRLWRRYLITNVSFLWGIGRDILRSVLRRCQTT